MSEERIWPSLENDVRGMPCERVWKIEIKAQGKNSGWNISVHCERPRGGKVVLMARTDSLDDALDGVHKELTSYREPTDPE